MTPRKCYECGGVIRQERKDYKYKECGLPNVVLARIPVDICTQCGIETPEIPSVAGLHRLLMMMILKKNTVLCGEEIRFLRKMARLKATELGRLIGADSTTLSKWENNARKIGAKADRVLRLVCYTGMLERMLKVAKDESITGSIASRAPDCEAMDIRELLSKIENKKKGPMPLFIAPETLRHLGSDYVDPHEGKVQ